MAGPDTLPSMWVSGGICTYQHVSVARVAGCIGAGGISLFHPGVLATRALLRCLNVWRASKEGFSTGAPPSGWMVEFSRISGWPRLHTSGEVGAGTDMPYGTHPRVGSYCAMKFSGVVALRAQMQRIICLASRQKHAYVSSLCEMHAKLRHHTISRVVERKERRGVR